MQTRRKFLTTTIGAAVILPYASLAAGKGFDTFQGHTSKITVHPISHASFVMQVPGMVIYNDPVGNAAAYTHLPPPDLILLTHHHSDHYAPETLNALVVKGTRILANPTVYEKLSETLKAKATSISNGQDTSYDAVKIEAIAAYNTTEARMKYHPKGRDNGYVINVDGLRFYSAGDTEDVAEMRALKHIDVAFLPMILPYTMDAKQAVSAVEAFKPTFVYPYHYKKPYAKQFTKLVSQGSSGAQVMDGAWY